MYRQRRVCGGRGWTARGGGHPSGKAARQAAARRAASGEAGAQRASRRRRRGRQRRSRRRRSRGLSGRAAQHGARCGRRGTATGRGQHGGLAGGGEAGGERRGRRGRWHGASVAWPCVCGGGGARQQQTQTKTKTSLGETGSSRPNREQSRSGLVETGPRKRQQHGGRSRPSIDLVVDPQWRPLRRGAGTAVHRSFEI